MEEKGHVIRAVNPGSIAQEMGIEQGDRLLAIDGQEIRDIFDYQYYIQDEYIEVLVEKHSGEEWLLEIDKEYEEDLGVEFENGLMDDYRSCRNRCIFCFIDQMPKGMRDTLYFKDDDSRLSFLQGNYVTLTNTSEEDIDRIIRYHLSPINISFQTTDPELRCKMLHNRFAGEALKKVDRLYAGGIRMNGQIVLCKGVNDKGELNRSIRDLTKYIPQLESVSVVPVGLSKYREGLYPLEPFTKEDAREVIAMIHGWQEEIYALHGIHFIHASDEWYILAELPLPEASRYDGYLQLENGVGMVRLLKEEVKEMLTELQRSGFRLQKKREVSLATGLLPFRYIQEMAEELMRMQSHLTVRVYPIRNDFFGELITVSGLLTGGDIQTQLMGKELGEELLLPQNVLRSGEDVFLDDMTVSELGNTLQVNINIVKSSGRDFVKKILGIV
jgi:putative radical SAM enzyme (TIGR03279 family)